MSYHFYEFSTVPTSKKLDIYFNLRAVVCHKMRMNAISGRGDEQRVDYYGRTNWKIIGVDEIWIVIFIQEYRHLRKKTSYFIIIFFVLLLYI